MTRTVERVGRILNAFTADQPQLSLTACAQVTELSKSSVYRPLKSLEEIGLVERDLSEWRLGPGVVSLATVRLGRFDLREEAARHLRDLRTMFHAAVAFSLPEGSDMIYLDRLDSPDAVGVSARLGARAPMWAGASGLAVLASMRPHERQQRLSAHEWRRLPQDVRGRVLKEIGRAEERGYAVDTGAFFNGIGGVAIAVTDHHDTPICAISVIAPSERLTEDFTSLVGGSLKEVADQLAPRP